MADQEILEKDHIKADKISLLKEGDHRVGMQLTGDGLTRQGQEGDLRPLSDLDADKYSYSDVRSVLGGVSDQEIARTGLHADYHMIVDRLELRGIGGVEDSNVHVRVYNETKGQEIGRATLGEVVRDLGQTDPGDVITIQESNSTSVDYEAHVNVIGRIKKA